MKAARIGRIGRIGVMAATGPGAGLLAVSDPASADLVTPVADTGYIDTVHYEESIGGRCPKCRAGSLL